MYFTIFVVGKVYLFSDKVLFKSRSLKRHIEILSLVLSRDVSQHMLYHDVYRDTDHQTLGLNSGGATVV